MSHGASRRRICNLDLFTVATEYSSFLLWSPSPPWSGSGSGGCLSTHFSLVCVTFPQIARFGLRSHFQYKLESITYPWKNMCFDCKDAIYQTITTFTMLFPSCFQVRHPWLHRQSALVTTFTFMLPGDVCNDGCIASVNGPCRDRRSACSWGQQKLSQSPNSAVFLPSIASIMG